MSFAFVPDGQILIAKLGSTKVRDRTEALQDVENACQNRSGLSQWKEKTFIGVYKALLRLIHTEKEIYGKSAEPPPAVVDRLARAGSVMRQMTETAEELGKFTDRSVSVLSEGIPAAVSCASDSFGVLRPGGLPLLKTVTRIATAEPHLQHLTVAERQGLLIWVIGLLQLGTPQRLPQVASELLTIVAQLVTSSGAAEVWETVKCFINSDSHVTGLIYPILQIAENLLRHSYAESVVLSHKIATDMCPFIARHWSNRNERIRHSCIAVLILAVPHLYIPQVPTESEAEAEAERFAAVRAGLAELLVAMLEHVTENRGAALIKFTNVAFRNVAFNPVAQSIFSWRSMYLRRRTECIEWLSVYVTCRVAEVYCRIRIGPDLEAQRSQWRSSAPRSKALTAFAAEPSLKRARLTPKAGIEEAVRQSCGGSVSGLVAQLVAFPESELFLAGLQLMVAYFQFGNNVAQADWPHWERIVAQLAGLRTNLGGAETTAWLLTSVASFYAVAPKPHVADTDLEVFMRRSMRVLPVPEISRAASFLCATVFARKWPVALTDCRTLVTEAVVSGPVGLNSEALTMWRNAAPHITGASSFPRREAITVWRWVVAQVESAKNGDGNGIFAEIGVAELITFLQWLSGTDSEHCATTDTKCGAATAGEDWQNYGGPGTEFLLLDAYMRARKPLFDFLTLGGNNDETENIAEQTTENIAASPLAAPLIVPETFQPFLLQLAERLATDLSERIAAWDPTADLPPQLIAEIAGGVAICGFISEFSDNHKESHMDSSVSPSETFRQFRDIFAEAETKITEYFGFLREKCASASVLSDVGTGQAFAPLLQLTNCPLSDSARNFAQSLLSTIGLNICGTKSDSVVTDFTEFNHKDDLGPVRASVPNWAVSDELFAETECSVCFGPHQAALRLFAALRNPAITPQAEETPAFLARVLQTLQAAAEAAEAAGVSGTDGTAGTALLAAVAEAVRMLRPSDVPNMDLSGAEKFVRFCGENLLAVYRFERSPGVLNVASTLLRLLLPVWGKARKGKVAEVAEGIRKDCLDIFQWLKTAAEADYVAGQRPIVALAELLVDYATKPQFQPVDSLIWTIVAAKPLYVRYCVAQLIPRLLCGTPAAQMAVYGQLYGSLPNGASLAQRAAVLAVLAGLAGAHVGPPVADAVALNAVELCATVALAPYVWRVACLVAGGQQHVSAYVRQLREPLLQFWLTAEPLEAFPWAGLGFHTVAEFLNVVRGSAVGYIVALKVAENADLSNELEFIVAEWGKAVEKLTVAQLVAESLPEIVQQCCVVAQAAPKGLESWLRRNGVAQPPLTELRAATLHALFRVADVASFESGIAVAQPVAQMVSALGLSENGDATVACLDPRLGLEGLSSAVAWLELECGAAGVPIWDTRTVFPVLASLLQDVAQCKPGNAQTVALRRFALFVAFQASQPEAEATADRAVALIGAIVAPIAATNCSAAPLGRNIVAHFLRVAHKRLSRQSERMCRVYVDILYVLRHMECGYKWLTKEQDWVAVAELGAQKDKLGQMCHSLVRRVCGFDKSLLSHDELQLWLLEVPESHMGKLLAVVGSLLRHTPGSADRLAKPEYPNTAEVVAKMLAAHCEDATVAQWKLDLVAQSFLAGVPLDATLIPGAESSLWRSRGSDEKAEAEKPGKPAKLIEQLLCAVAQLADSQDATVALELSAVAERYSELRLRDRRLDKAVASLDLETFIPDSGNGKLTILRHELPKQDTAPPVACLQWLITKNGTANSELRHTVAVIPRLMEVSPKFAESIVPILALGLVVGRSRHLPEFEEAVEAQLANGDTVAQQKWLETFMFIRRHVMSRDPTQFLKLGFEIDKTRLFRAAMNLGRPHTALMLLEEHLADPCCATADGKLDADTARRLQAAYRALDDADALHGLPLDVSFETIMVRHSGAGGAAAAARHSYVSAVYGEALRAQCGVAGAARDLAGSLLDCGYYGAAECVAQFQNQQFASSGCATSYEPLWRLGQWDVATPSIHSDCCASELFYALFSGLNVRRGSVRSRLEFLRGYKSRIAEFFPVKTSTNAEQLRGWAAAAAAMWETEKIERMASSVDCGSDSPFVELLSALENQNVAQNVAFNDVEPVLYARTVALAGLRHEMPNSGVALPLLEAFSLSWYARAARGAGEAQKALNAAVQVVKLAEDCGVSGVVNSSITSFGLSLLSQMETAESLWSIRETQTAITVLQKLLDTPQLIPQCRAAPLGSALARLVPQLYATIANWCHNARLSTPAEVADKFWEPAVAQLETVAAPQLTQANIHFAYAAFCHAQLRHRLQDALAQRRKQQAARRAELAVLERQAVAQQRNKLSGSSASATTELRRTVACINYFKAAGKADEAETEALEASQRQLAATACREYVACVAVGGGPREAAVKLLSVWLKYANEETVSEAVAQLFNSSGAELPYAEFLDWVPQLTARLGDPETPQIFRHTLRRLLTGLFATHPYHSLYHLAYLLLRHSTAEPQDSAAVARSEAATELASRLRSATGVLDDVLELCDHVAQLASASVAPRVKRVTVAELPGAQWWLKSLRQLRLPCPTAFLPVDKCGAYRDVPRMVAVAAPVAIAASGVSRPKIVALQCNDGRIHRMVVKGGADDLRQDAVMEQVFGLVNLLVGKSGKRVKSGAGNDINCGSASTLTVRTYRVIPLQPSGGMLEFVDNSVALAEYLTVAHRQFRPNDLPVKEARAEIAEAATGDITIRRKIYTEITEKIQPVLKFFFFTNYPEPHLWYAARRNYTRGTAAVSIVGYILGLGDRHCNNILLDKATGEPVHIDLGVAFDQGKLLPIPETVPFRLTRDIVDGFGVTKVEGTFRRSCERVLAALQAEREAIISVLDVLRYDPLYTWSLSPLRLNRLQDGTAGIEIPEEKEKFRRREDGLEADVAISTVEKKLLSEGLSVEAVVNMLIQEATDPAKLALLYAGWMAFL